MKEKIIKTSTTTVTTKIIMMAVKKTNQYDHKDNHRDDHKDNPIGNHRDNYRFNVLKKYIFIFPIKKSKKKKLRVLLPLSSHFKSLGHTHNGNLCVGSFDLEQEIQY